MVRLKSRLRLTIQCIIVIAVLSVVDQFTKLIASDMLSEGPVRLIPGVFELYYVENHGAAFGILQNRQWPLVVFALIVLCVVLWLYPRIKPERRYRLLRICCCMLCAGALGNLIDRIRLGYVIDFLYIALINFPVFNVADIYVTVSCCILLFSLLFIYREEEILC